MAKLNLMKGNKMKRLNIKKMKRRIFLLFRRHYKIYTMLAVAFGVFLGLLYEGRGDIGEYVFSFNDYYVYIGGFEKAK